MRLLLTGGTVFQNGSFHQMDVAMDNRIVRSSMPVATIPGKRESFVLLSGHYDSWYEGMTDNGAANVLMLETAKAEPHRGDCLVVRSFGRALLRLHLVLRPSL